MSSGPSSTGSDGVTSDRPTELIALLDSDDAETVEQTKAIVYENLYKSRDPSLLNALVDCYLETRSTTALQILTNIHEGKIHNLFEKLNDCLKHYELRGRIDTLTLLGHIVRKQPSWLYKIVKTPLFETVVKCMKSESDVLFLINGVLTITTLLPIIATYVESWLNDFFEIYTRLTGFLNSRPGNIPDVYLLHLHVAVYFYFHRIYAMYPNNFLIYLRGFCYNNVRKQIVFQTTIKPMLEHVRLHPCLITETSQSETGKHRWRKKEPQDIVIECQNISLDPIDRIQTDSSLTASWTSWQEALTLDKSVNSALTTSEDHTKEIYDIPRIKERRMSDSATQTGKSLQSGDSGTGSIPLISSEDYTSGWSPSEVCGLTTPPSSHMSPATSNQDLAVSQTNISVSQSSTPALINTPGDSPTSSLAGDLVHNSPALFKNKRPLGKVSSGKSTSSIKPVGMESPLIHKALNSTSLQSKGETKTGSSMADNQTSTPKSENSINENSQAILSPGIDRNKFNSWSFERQTSEVSIQSEPVTPIDKSYTYEYIVHSIKPEHEMQEELTCSDHGETTENAAKEIKRILSQSNFVSLQDDTELPINPPPSLEVSLLSGNNISSNNLIAQELQHINLPNDKITQVLSDDLQKNLNSLSGHTHEELNLITNKSESKSTLISKSSEASESSVRTPSVTPTPQDDHHVSYDSDSLALLLTQTGQYPGARQEQDEDCKRYLTLRPTPVEILDNYIQVGSGVHLNEVTRLSLISSPETDWTHFGGDAPVDEITILRGQIQLLHHQLLYERHKCDQHAIRNRRLIGKTFKAVQYQEELLAIKDHLKLQEEKMRELTESLVNQTEDNSKFKEITSGWDNQQQTQLRNLLNENAKLQHDKKTLKETLGNQKKDHDCLLMQLNQCQAKVLTSQNEIDHMKPKLTEKSQLKYELERLTKELLIMGELNQHQKDVIEKASLNKGRIPEASLQFHSCQKELTASKQTVRKQRAEVDALHSKVAELEKTLTKKDLEMTELKKFSESLNGRYLAKLKALEEKYDAQKKINQSMEAHVLNLQLALVDTKHMKQAKMPKTRAASACQSEAVLSGQEPTQTIPKETAHIETLH